MKKTTAILIIALSGLVSMQASSQTSAGPLAGLNFNSLSGDAPAGTEYSSGFGYMFGISSETYFAKDLKIVIQPNYSQYTTTIAFDVGQKDYKDSLKLSANFFRVPVLVKFEALNGVTYFTSGLDIGFLSKASYNDLNKTLDDKDITEMFNSVDVAALFGVGAALPLGSFTGSGELRYSQSLLNLSSQTNSSLFSSLSPRFRFSGFQFQLNFSYKF